MTRSELQRKSELQRHSPLKNTYPKPKKRHASRGKEYTRELRQYVAERDGWCRVCGMGGDQVHHVITRKRFQTHPERYTMTSEHDERNLMWICWKCHTWTHASEANLQTVIQIQEERFGALRQPEFAYESARG